MTTGQGEPQGDPVPEPQGEGQQPPPQGDGKDTKPQGNAPPPKPKPKPAETDWKAEARKWEKQAKADAEARENAKRILEGKDAELTAAQQATAAADLTRMRYEIAYANNLPPDLAERLRGDTEDEIKEDAKKLAAYAKPKPKSDARADDKGGGDTKESPNEMLRRLAGVRT